MANQFHFHWLRASHTAIMKAALVRVVKKAKKVFRVILRGSVGSALPSKVRNTATMTRYGELVRLPA